MFNSKQTYVLIGLFLCSLLMFIVLYNRDVNTTPVYCLMVTGHDDSRYKFAQLSVLNFKRQTYKNKVLIIINQSSKNRLVQKEEVDNILEVFVDTGDKSLGEIRNISLQFVPPNAIWTTWDDDDWRHDDYLSHMTSEMQKQQCDFLMFTNRIEYNINNSFSYKLTLKTGLMTFFSKQNPRLLYDHVSTSEDKVIKEYATGNMKTFVYDNDCRYYIRIVHSKNTSVYVQNTKNKLKDTQYHKFYFENELNKNERRFVDNIISKYYKHYVI